MNAPVAKTPGAARVVPAIDVLEIRAQIRAFLWWQYQMEIDEAATGKTPSGRCSICDRSKMSKARRLAASSKS
jgi:hypothetical protein